MASRKATTRPVVFPSGIGSILELFRGTAMKLLPLLLLVLPNQSSNVALVRAFSCQRTKPSPIVPHTKNSCFSASSDDDGSNRMRHQTKRYSTTAKNTIGSTEEIDVDSTIGGKINGRLGLPTDGVTVTISPPPTPAELNHSGKCLALSLGGRQNPILLFDGLSPETWTAARPDEGSSSAPLPSSFSSLALQTRIPSTAIESLCLGNFLPSSAPDNSHDSPQRRLQHPHKFLAASRLNRYWMGPKFGGTGVGDNSGETIPVDTQFLLVEIEPNEPGTSPADSSPPFYALMMPLVDGGFRSALESTSDSIKDDNDNDDNTSSTGDDRRKMTLVSYSESGEILPPQRTAGGENPRNALYVAVHNEPFELLKLGFRQVSELLGKSFETLDQKQVPTGFLNSFGWCSWDAFYSKVHPTGILEGVQCLTDAGVPVKNVILDDGWQQVSPPYLHQQEEDEGKKTSSLAASLSLSGSSDIMPDDDHSDISSSSSLIKSVTSSILKNPLEMLSNIGGSIFGMIAGSVTKCYQKYVENAPVNSFPKRLWTFLARHSPLNYGLWKFFDSETDFGRQLDDFDPNWKFLESTARDESEASEGNTKKNMALKELVATLKNDWKVNRVYCWHSIHGYWRGVSSELGESIGIDVTQVKTRPSDHLLRIEPEMAFDPPSLFGVGLIAKKRDLSKFYKHLHEPLVAAGVDGVKVDVQSGITAAGMRGDNFDDCPPLAKIYTQAMEESVAMRFPSTTSSEATECINCMCHSTENLYRYAKTSVARASDDFYPARPESHSVHLVNVAYNSLFLGEICLPDWDMFHSKHESAELHAAARAIGGCAVYVSDAPGKHDIPLLKKLVLPDGSVLRAQQPGRPTRDCIFADVGRDGISALKIWNVNRSQQTSISTKQSLNIGSGGVIGTFNVQGVSWNFENNENEVLDASPPAVTAIVKPHDVDILRQIVGPFAVWSHRTQSMVILPTGDSTIETVLQHREWEVHTVQPIQLNEDFNVQWAPIGLGKMLNSGGAILNAGRLIESDSCQEGNGNAFAQRKQLHADITTRGPGHFVSFCQPRPSYLLIRSGLTSKQLDFQHDEHSGLLGFDLPTETLEGKAHHVTVIWEQ